MPRCVADHVADAAKAGAEIADSLGLGRFAVTGGSGGAPHALACGAEILEPPTDYPYGERQYKLRDIGGHRWMFSQTLADVHPDAWGGPDVVLKAT